MSCALRGPRNRTTLGRWQSGRGGTRPENEAEFRTPSAPSDSKPYMILKGLDESFTPSIDLVVVRARSLEICSRTHTKDPDLKKDPTLALHSLFL